MRSLYGVWPLIAFMEVKNKYAYVITQDICNKFIEVNFFEGCMVSRQNLLFQDLTIMSLINKMTKGMPFQMFGIIELWRSYHFNVIL